MLILDYYLEGTRKIRTFALSMKNDEILDYYLEGTRKIRTFALSMKNDEICGLPSQQKFPCARVNVSSGEPKTESIQRQVKIINNNLLIF